MTVNSNNSSKSNGGNAATSVGPGTASANGDHSAKEASGNYISMVNVNNLTRDQLASILNYVNSIYKENLPVKCILLTLKTVIRSLECDMAEICQVVENSLVINHISRESPILHKRVVNYNEARHNNWLYNRVYGSIAHGREVSGLTYVNGSRAMANYNSNSGASTKVHNVLWVPLYNVHEMVWGALLMFNVKGDDPEEPGEELKLEEAAQDREEDEAAENEDQSSEATQEESEIEHNEEELQRALSEEELNFLQELCYIGGIVISNMSERIELEINRSKSNSLITLMHSLFSDQLSIQSIIISLTTHAKKLLQVENCAIYLFDHLHNQLLSISSNKYIVNNNVSLNGNSGASLNVHEFISSSDDLNNNILLYCLNSCNVIIYDSNYNNANGASQELSSNLRNNNVVIINEVNENYNNIRNGIWIPIKSEGNKLLGILEVVNKQEQELLNFTEDDLNLLLLFTIIITPQFEKFEFVNLYNTTSPELSNNNIELINNATPPANNLNANAASLELNNANPNLNNNVEGLTEAGLAFEYNINIKNNLNNLNNIKNFLDYSIKEEEVEEE